MTDTCRHQPNVLVMMSDEQSWATMGCTGNPAAVTPHLDDLCDDATSLDRCYTPFPLCCPSRASLWTGLMPRHHRVLGNWRPIDRTERTGGLAQAFRRHGYHTLYCGKWHVPGTTPGEMGWRDAVAIPAVVEGRDRGRYIPAYRDYAAGAGYQLDPHSMENLTRGDVERIGRPGAKPWATAEIRVEDFLETWQTDQFLAALARRPDDRPWLAACSYNAPHFPMVVPRPYDSIVDRHRVVLPASLSTGPVTKPREVRESRFATDFTHLGEADWIQLIAHYLGLVALVDAQLGRVVEYLRAEGEWDRTIVVFTSDHGDMMGAHGLMEKGHLLHYEETLRVPLILRHPGTPAARSEALVSVCDIGPTLAALAEVDWAAATDGTSFADLLGKHAATAGDRYVTAETAAPVGSPAAWSGPLSASNPLETESLNLSIRTATTRYIWRSNDEDELYDLRKDPHEQVNRARQSDYEQLRWQCRARLADEVADSFPIVAERLRSGQGRSR